MRYQTMWHSSAAPGGRAGVVAIFLSTAMLLPVPATRAADLSSGVAETPPVGSGPLTPIHRDPPTPADRPAAKPPTAAKAPAPPKSPAAPAAAAVSVAPSSGRPEAPAPKPQRSTAAPAAKPTATASTQPEKKPAPGSTQAEKKLPPGERTAERERRHRHTEPETAQQRGPVYRDYVYQAPGRGYAPPPDYGEAPAEIGPGPYAPSWYYGERPLAYGPYAYGPYSGMRGPRPMPW